MRTCGASRGGRAEARSARWAAQSPSRGPEPLHGTVWRTKVDRVCAGWICLRRRRIAPGHVQ